MASSSLRVAQRINRAIGKVVLNGSGGVAARPTHFRLVCSHNHMPYIVIEEDNIMRGKRREWKMALVTITIRGGA